MSKNFVTLRTGKNENKNIKIDYQGSKTKSIKKIQEEIHILSYIKAGTDGKNQIYWFESDKAGRIYILADKALYSMGFYNLNYKTKDIKVFGKVFKNKKLIIKEILEK